MMGNYCTMLVLNSLSKNNLIQEERWVGGSVGQVYFLTSSSRSQERLCFMKVDRHEQAKAKAGRQAGRKAYR
jgi:hypothetical protein